MSALGQVAGFAMFLAAALGLAAAILWTIDRFATRSPLREAEPSRLDVLDHVHYQCTVPLCDDPATVWLHVGHEYWTFCVPHGVPYLTEGLAS